MLGEAYTVVNKNNRACNDHERQEHSEKVCRELTVEDAATDAMSSLGIAQWTSRRFGSREKEG